MTTRENWRTGIITLAAAIVWLLSSVTTHAQAPASIQATRRRPTAYFAREPWRAYWLDMATERDLWQSGGLQVVPLTRRDVTIIARSRHERGEPLGELNLHTPWASI